jgi:glycosyltransferase involved in cell wall biosynthesis
VRILHITSDWKWTGPAEPMLHLLQGLRARGHHVDLACPLAPPDSRGALAERAAERGVEVAHELVRGQGYLPLRDRAEVQRLRQFVKSRGHDVVHAHHTSDHLLCIRALRSLDSRLVYSWHHGHAIKPRVWNRWLLGPGRSTGLTLLSERLAEAARRELGWPARRLLILPGVVDAERFAARPRSRSLAAELAIESDQRVLGVVARLQPQRRFDLLLAAFQRALAAVPQLRLLVVGRGTRARQVLEEPVQRMGLSDAVIRAGYRRDDYPDVLSLMDGLCFLVPGSDGSCRAVLEAMAMEIPVISSRRGILPETVVDGVTGRVVDEDEEALAEAFVELGRDAETWRARGRAARQRALERHRVDPQVELLEGFYGRLLRDPAAVR